MRRISAVLTSTFLLFAAAVPVTAQQSARLTGRILNGTNGTPLPGANVELATARTTTSLDGRYHLTGLDSGTVSLRITLIGFAPKTVTGIRLTQGKVTELDVTMNPQTVQLEELTVTAGAEQGSVGAALDEQRHSVAIVNAVSAEQISRSPDGDAAAAVQRVNGATVQDGKYVSFRGLGDRYTQASLNGSRIPSPEPEKKVVPLDLFPASLLSGITASKTFTPDQPGDFSGGSVDIRTREFAGKSFLSISAGTGLNSPAIGRSGSYAPGTSSDWLAMGSGDRALPGILRSTDFSSPLSGASTNEIVNSLRNVWSARPRRGSPNGSLGVAAGGAFFPGGLPATYLVSGTWSRSEDQLLDQRRALAATVSSGDAEEVDRYDGTTGRASVLWGGLANFSLALGSHSKVSLNNTYNRTMDNEGRLERGYSENLALPLEIQRLRYVERSVYSSQLGLQSEFGNGRHGLDVGLTVSGVSRDEPDRSEIVYTTVDGQRQWLGFSNEAAVRTFAALDESSVEARAGWRLALGNPADGRTLHVGVLHRRTERDADNTAYSISLTRSLGGDDLSRSPEQLFGGDYSTGDDATFRVVPLGAGGSYTASDRLSAGYGMLMLPLGGNLEMIVGARVEDSRVEVDSRSTAGEPSTATPSFTDLLPAAALTWRTASDMNFRLSATRTLARPEYRELSPILFREVIGFDNVKGNPALRRTLIHNLDLRWEWYPSRGEAVSVGLFAKDFDGPIERIYQGTSGTRIITYVNAERARTYGVEVEGRRSLGFIDDRIASLSLFANLTLMQSEVTIDADGGAITSTERRMVGQAPYVVNLGLTWAPEGSDWSATALFNRVGPRITEAGELPLPDVVEKPRSMLDVSLRLPLHGSAGLKFDARNLLDSRHRVTQGDVIREQWRTGRAFSMGLSWQL